MDIRHLSLERPVAPQSLAAAQHAVRGAGLKAVICNRPDWLARPERAG